VQFFEIGEEDRGGSTIVLGSDGIWDVLSNEEVALLLQANALQKEKAKGICEQARKKWEVQSVELFGKDSRGYQIDDITCIVVSL